jgi:hypothetical protein
MLVGDVNARALCNPLRFDVAHEGILLPIDTGRPKNPLPIDVIV